MSSKIHVDELEPKTDGKFVDIKDSVDCRLSSTATQACANGWTYLTFDKAVTDTHNMADLDNDAIVIPTGYGGWYWMKCVVRAHAGWIANRNIIQFYVNGVSKDFNEVAADATTGRYATVEVTAVLKLEDGDSLKGRFYHNYGSTKDIYGADNDKVLQIHRLGG